MKLPNRKQQKTKPTALPKDFLKTVSDLLKKQFSKEVKGSEFLVYSDLYTDEVILCVSLSDAKSLRAASMHLSTDLGLGISEQPEKVTEALKNLVDIAASWFAQSLKGGNGLDSVLDEMADLDTKWQKIEWEGLEVFVKLNRDNYALEKAANDFLKKNGFEDDGDDSLESFSEEEDKNQH